MTSGALGRVTFVERRLGYGERPRRLAGAVSARQSRPSRSISRPSSDRPPAQPFDPARFFRWRVYNAFGSGLVGARFVPQLTAVQWLLDLPAPVRATAHGAQTRWRDGRDVPDTLVGTFEYERGRCRSR